jgi:hypothetical protein
MKSRMFLWAIVGFAVAALAGLLVIGTTTVPANPLSLAVLTLVSSVSPIGCFWMLFIVIRYERHPLPWILLAFVPFFAVGYYFERARRNRIEPCPSDTRADS